MRAITDAQITEYVEANIGELHEKRLDRLTGLKLNLLLRRKNPYLFRAKDLTTASELVRSLLDAHLSSQEETLFGNFLEGLAVHVAQEVHGGWKSSATGIDLEFIKDDIRYIVSIKSGPNWGNSSQITRMKQDFTTARRVILQGDRNTNVVAVNGCCYGRDTKPNKGDYFKYCGEEFWHLISGDADFFTRIIESLGHNAKRRNEEFTERYAAIIDQFSAEFVERFCSSDGMIDWHRFVSFGSAKNPP